MYLELMLSPNVSFSFFSEKLFIHAKYFYHDFSSLNIIPIIEDDFYESVNVQLDFLRNLISVSRFGLGQFGQ